MVALNRVVNMLFTYRPENFTDKQHEERIKAVQYLAAYSLTRFDKVAIYDDGKADLLAVFKKGDNDESFYVIGAIWREELGRYTFHS